MKKFLVYLMAFSIIFITNINTTQAAEYEAAVYVSTGGDDAASGLTLEQSVKTLEKAVQIMRTLKTKDETGVIYMSGGIYRISEAVVFKEEDSNLTIKNYDNNPVEIYGSAQLSDADFTTVTDRNILYRMPKAAWGKVKQADITELCGELISYPDDNLPFDGETGYYELYSGEKRQTLARWPNNTNDIVTGVQSDSLTLTVANAERAKRWADAEKPILQGFLGTGLYHRCNVSAEYIYSETGQIKLSRYPYYEAQPNKEYFIYNLLEELDAPGEWFVENTNAKTILYYYPTEESSENGKLEFALNTEGALKINGASNITIENIDFSYFAATAVAVEASDNITVKNCDITHMSRNAVTVKASKNCSIEGCEIANLGGSAIFLNGGDNVTLEPGNNRVSNCKIHSAGYTYCASQPSGVLVRGNGNSVENSDLFDLMHGAVTLEGSMNKVSGNEIHNVLKIPSDAGAIYIGLGLLAFGNTIENNYMHDIRDGNEECVAIYIDDCSHGVTVTGNVLEKVGRGVLCGGGRNNTFKSNILIDEGIYYDVRGMADGWAHAVWDVGGNLDKQLAELEENPDYDEEKFISVYPEFKEIVDDIKKRREDPSYDSGIPKNVVITDNVSINASETAHSFLTPYMLKSGIIKRYGNADESNNYGINRIRAEFANFVEKDYTITASSPILKALPKFKRTDFRKIGAENGEYKIILQPDTLPASAEILKGNIAAVKPSYGTYDVNTSDNIEITLLEQKDSYELSIYAGNEKVDSGSYTVTIDGMNMVIDFKEDMLPECIYQVELGDAFTYFKTGRYSLDKVIEYDFDNAVPQIKTVTSASGATAGVVFDEISGSKVLEISFPEGNGEYAVLTDSEAVEYDRVIVKYKLRVDGYNKSNAWRMYCQKMPQFTSDDGKSVTNLNSFGGSLSFSTADGKRNIGPRLIASYIQKYLTYETEIDFKNKTISGRQDLVDISKGYIRGSFENAEAQNLYSLRFKGESGEPVTVWLEDLAIECYNECPLTK